MHRQLAAASIATVLVLALAACTPVPESPSTPTAAAPTDSPSGDANPGRFPTCGSVTEALGSLVDGLAFDADISASQQAQEEYEQRVCVFTTDDASTQLGVTIAAIPFLQGELDSYATLPNALQDPRLEEHGGVLQTFAAGDGDDGHLDGALYLFDTEYSVTIQGDSSTGTTAASLPGLTLPAATDAAFAVRNLIS